MQIRVTTSHSPQQQRDYTSTSHHGQAGVSSPQQEEEPAAVDPAVYHCLSCGTPYQNEDEHAFYAIISSFSSEDQLLQHINNCHTDIIWVYFHRFYSIMNKYINFYTLHFNEFTFTALYRWNFFIFEWWEDTTLRMSIFLFRLWDYYMGLTTVSPAAYFTHTRHVTESG